MDFRNSTDLDSTRLERMLVGHTWPYAHRDLCVRVRYSRGAAFSGTCYYDEARIFVNLGRQNVYPYRLATHIARSQSNRTHWWRETYRLIIADGYQLTLFVYLHELYHLLAYTAGRSPKRKEAMCDRFATRALVDHYHVSVLDRHGRRVSRQNWDFQDLDKFVATAPKATTLFELPSQTPPRQVPVTINGVRTGTRRSRRAGR